nr:zinc-ribbon domain-containing protein [Pseudomonas sp.]
MVTRCPQCRAAFRVVAEQLRLRDGKVRCGVCNAVFDARAHQEPAPQQPAQQQPTQQQSAPQAPAPQTPAVVVRPPPAAEAPAGKSVERPASVAAVRLRVAEAQRKEPAVPAAARE